MLSTLFPVLIQINVQEVTVSTAKIGALQATVQSVVSWEGHAILVGVNEFVSMYPT